MRTTRCEADPEKENEATNGKRKLDRFSLRNTDKMERPGIADAKTSSIKRVPHD
jgi:hypothetical protein